MRRFYLHRTSDPSGVSGPGDVAEGVEFSDGTCAMHWLTSPHRSTGLYGSIAAVKHIHGHDGRTEIIWIDEE